MKVIMFRIANMKQLDELRNKAERLCEELTATVKDLKDFEFELIAQATEESDPDRDAMLSIAEMEAINKLRYPEIFKSQR